MWGCGMSFATAIRNRNSDRLIALVTAIGVVMSLMVIFAPAALAHHPTITADQICEDDGSKSITYTSVSWWPLDSDDDRGVNPDVRIELKVGTGSWTEVDSGEYNSANNYRFSNKFNGDAYTGMSIQLRAQVEEPWGNGSTGGNSDPDATTGAFVVLDDCTPDEKPVTVTVEHENCVIEVGEGISTDPGHVTVTISPESGATVTVLGPDSYDEDFTGIGGSDELLPGDYTWTATAEGDHVLEPPTSGKFTIVDCPKIILRKNVIGNDDETEFGFISPDLEELFGGDGEFDTEIFLGHDGVAMTYVPAGTYEIFESDVPKGWSLDSVSCDDSDSGRIEGDGVQYVVGAGETVTCTFNNKKDTPPGTTPPVDTTTSTKPEILPTSITAAPTTIETQPVDTLPFTGVASGTYGLLALALIGIGALALVATRRAED